jgi:hypothetical protein
MTRFIAPAIAALLGAVMLLGVVATIWVSTRGDKAAADVLRLQRIEAEPARLSTYLPHRDDRFWSAATSPRYRVELVQDGVVVEAIPAQLESFRDRERDRMEHYPSTLAGRTSVRVVDLRRPA